MNKRTRKKYGFKKVPGSVCDCGIGGNTSVEKYINKEGKILIQISNSEKNDRIFENQEKWENWLDENIDEEHFCQNFRAAIKIASRCCHYACWSYDENGDYTGE